jgi:hypothetical protein
VNLGGERITEDEHVNERLGFAHSDVVLAMILVYTVASAGLTTVTLQELDQEEQNSAEEISSTNYYIQHSIPIS